MTTGKCPECSKRYKCIVAYRWKARYGRRLYNARCHKCLVQLEQTAIPNAKNPIVRKVEPDFRLRSWQLEEDTNGQNA
jgi:hypothetical protein